MEGQTRAKSPSTRPVRAFDRRKAQRPELQKSPNEAIFDANPNQKKLLGPWQANPFPTRTKLLAPCGSLRKVSDP
jgi:hypothetical protein